MGTWKVWAGAISDTEYQARSGVFEYMQWFVDHFDKGIPFTNIIDKRCIAVSWQPGERKNSCCSKLRFQGATESSTHASSINRQQWYQRENNLYKSCILSTEFERPPNLVRDTGICSMSTMTPDQSGNENAVTVAKRLGVQERRLQPDERLKVMAEA